MTVSELIEILKKCDPSANVYSCQYIEDKVGGVGGVNFVESDLTNRRIFLYRFEPDWYEDCGEEYDPDVVQPFSIAYISNCFAKTTYREPNVF